MGAWDFLTVIDGTADDQRHYPVLSAEGARYPVELTGEDGVPQEFRVEHLRVLTAGPTGLVEALTVPSELDFTILVTDVRLIAYCLKYERGSTWFGTGAGAFVAVAAMAISAAAAARRRKGKVLVGHVRYQWVSGLLAKEHTGWLEPPKIRIDINRPDALGGAPFLVELTLHKKVDALGIAADVARRVALYRIGFDDAMDAAERRAFDDLAGGARRPMGVAPDGSRDWAEYRMPTSWPVTCVEPPRAAPLPPATPDAVLPPPMPAQQADRPPVPPPAPAASPQTPPAPPAPPAPAASRDCRMCTHHLPDYAAMCPRCGAPLPLPHA